MKTKLILMIALTLFVIPIITAYPFESYNPILYYKMNSSSGTNISDSSGYDYHGTAYNTLDWKPGIIDNSSEFGGNGDQINVTSILNNNQTSISVNLWFAPNQSYPGAANQFLFHKDIRNLKDRFNCYMNTNGNLTCFGEANNQGNWEVNANITWTVPKWHMVTLVWNNNTGTISLYIDSVLNNSASYAYAMDGADPTNSTFEIGYNSGGGPTSSIRGRIDEFGIWNKSLTHSEIETLYNSGDGFAFQTVVDSVNYSSTVYETDYQKLNVTLTTEISVLSISADLVYNGTSYDSTASCTSGTCTITNEIDIPLVSSTNKDENKTFYWEVSLYDGTTETTFNVSGYEQNVSRIYLEHCGTHTTKSLNFTAYDEGNLTRILNFSFSGKFDYWVGNGNIKRTYEFEDTSITNVTICINNTQERYIDALIEYDEEAGLSNYVKRQYWLSNYSINSTMEDIKLLLLKSASSTTFIQEVLENQIPVEDAYIYTYRYYPGINEWKLTQASVTDEDGKTVGFYEAETALYRHSIYVDDVIRLNETAGRTIIPEDVPYTITFNLGVALEKPWIGYDNETGLIHGITYNNNTDLVTFTYIDSNSTFESSRFTVYKERYYTTDQLICNTTSAIASATINCDVSSYSGNFIARGYITRGGVEILVNTYRFSTDTGKDTFGKTGVFLAWFIILVAAMAFIWHPIAGIIGVDVAVIFVNIIGLAHFGGVFIFGIIAVSIVTIWLFKD